MHANVYNAAIPMACSVSYETPIIHVFWVKIWQSDYGVFISFKTILLMMIFILMNFFSCARFAELEHFTSLPDKPIQAGNCDVVIQRPTIFMKLDAGKC